MQAAGEPQTRPSGPIYVPLRCPGGWRGFLPRRPATCRPHLHGQVPQTGLKTAPGFTLTVMLSALLMGWLLLSPGGHLHPRSRGGTHTNASQGAEHERGRHSVLWGHAGRTHVCTTGMRPRPGAEQVSWGTDGRARRKPAPGNAEPSRTGRELGVGNCFPFCFRRRAQQRGPS